ncbi:hypothetical protein TNCV_987371 [Trichonephila clavipes]|nr:hypothetical protein TNCV_987371 [Trichonephila clavipes]
MKKHFQGRRFVPSDEVNVASQEWCFEKWFPVVLSEAMRDLSATETYEMLKHMYSSDTLSRMQDFEWYRHFRAGGESVEDNNALNIRRLPTPLKTRFLKASCGCTEDMTSEAERRDSQSQPIGAIKPREGEDERPNGSCRQPAILYVIVGDQFH